MELLYTLTLDSFCIYIKKEEFYRKYADVEFDNIDKFNLALDDLYIEGYQLLGEDMTVQVSKETGDKLFKCIEEKYFENNSKSIEQVINAVIKFFIDGKYISSGEFIINDKDSRNVYGSLLKNQFFYVMKEPIIFNSAKRLYNKINVAPHFSSRTLEAAFRSINIIAEYDSSFDINEFDKTLVVEKWNYKPLN